MAILKEDVHYWNTYLTGKQVLLVGKPWHCLLGICSVAGVGTTMHLLMCTFTPFLKN